MTSIVTHTKLHHGYRFNLANSAPFNSLQNLYNKIWNLPDRSTILSKFIYDKEEKLVRLAQILPVRVSSSALILKTDSRMSSHAHQEVIHQMCSSAVHAPITWSLAQSSTISTGMINFKWSIHGAEATYNGFHKTLHEFMSWIYAHLIMCTVKFKDLCLDDLWTRLWTSIPQ